MTVSVVVPGANAACGGAPGKLKPGLGPLYSSTSAAIGATLAEVFGGPAGIMLVAVLAGVSFDLLNLCNAGDPGEVDLTYQDVIAAFHGELGDVSLQAVLKCQRWFTHVMYPVWCDCADGTKPPPASGNPPPAEVQNPNMSPGGFGPNCWDRAGRVNNNQHGTWDWQPITPQLGGLPGWSQPGVAPPQLLPKPLPQSFTLVGTVHNDGTGVNFWSGTVQFYDVAGALISAGSVFLGQTNMETVATMQGTVPTNAAYMYARYNSIGTLTPTNTASSELVFYCAGQTPDTPIVPCCPPDPYLDARLTFLTSLVQSLVANATAPIDALTDGATHGPFTGSGSVLLLQECAAVRVDVLSDLTGWPKNPGSPDYFFSLGFVTSYAEGTPLKGWRLVYSSQTYPVQTYADMIGWTLPPGVSIRVTEQIGAAAAG